MTAWTWLGIAAAGALTAAACGPAVESSAATGTGGGGGTAGSGGASPCGGRRGGTCASDEYCDYGDDLCGAADGGGVCKPRPAGCSKELQPTCGCDGQVHGNACEANSAGVDVSTMGCKAPPGTFACGSQFCALGQQFCFSEPEPPHPGYACTPLPVDCGSSPSCACLEHFSCGNCTPTPDGGLLVSCAAG